ncbi:class IV lanthionine synthetase LanL [Streptomyces sp. NPDC091267]|uniref:class IV lanthionine synthetase LanL n=1 Tax=Streptomyces sp. NPDC091267 TaxID=3155195 RepID=UPI00341DDEFC
MHPPRPESSGEPTDSHLLADLAQAALERHVSDWDSSRDGFWCRIGPAKYPYADQGWKLHVSATPLSAPFVLVRSAEVLLRRGCAFKFARDLDKVTALVERNYARGGGGKFLTAYPVSEEMCRHLARELHEATQDLHGPRILSDLPFRPGSLVHFRYGVFAAKPVLSNDGCFESLLKAPDGTLCKDERNAWFSPPAWAVPAPFEAPLPERGSATGKTVLVGDRFRVVKAIKHANRGGVFRAVDTRTSADVILKQARPHVDARLDGTDARDNLRHEARILELLAPLGIAPKAVAVVEEQGNVFLAQDLVPGTTLREWAQEHLRTTGAGAGISVSEAVPLAAKVADLLVVAHGIPNLVLRDFTPQNIMVSPEGQVSLVDLEAAVTEGTVTHRIQALAYSAPEQSQAPRFGLVPSRRADLHSLGMVLFYLATGRDPLLVGPVANSHAGQERLAALVAVMQGSQPSLRALAPAILGLTADKPEDRWSLEQVRRFLAGLSSPTGTRPASSVQEPMKPTGHAKALLADGLEHVMSIIRPDEGRLHGSSAFGSTTDPCNVQHGSAGVLGVLVRAARVIQDPALISAVHQVADWTLRRAAEVRSTLPGLHFGRSGTAWALHDAAQLLGNDALAQRAVQMAEAVTLDWANPDVCHGLAGAGMAHWQLWKTTGRSGMRTRALLCADSVLTAARHREGRVVWPVPAAFRSDLAGLVHFGFAHGVAGAGAFLLTSAQATGRQEYFDAALEAGRTLRGVADIKGNAACWPTGEATRRARSDRMQHWCSGASGVGTFLVRLWRASGDPEFLDLAKRAAETVHQARWYSGNAVCHGLAGDGEFLLDMAELTGDPCYRDRAEQMAEVMYAFRVQRGGLGLVTDESALVVTADYGTGLSGVLGFLLRLEHGGSRMWMPDLPAEEDSLDRTTTSKSGLNRRPGGRL